MTLCITFVLLVVIIAGDPSANMCSVSQPLVFQQIEADEYMDAASHAPVVRFYGITEVSVPHTILLMFALLDPHISLMLTNDRCCIH